MRGKLKEIMIIDAKEIEQLKSLYNSILIY